MTPAGQGKTPEAVRMLAQGLGVFLAACVFCNGCPAQSRNNVLFIVIDDLGAQLACMGYPGIRTPNMDQLASRGMLFHRAYVQQALCAPSRASALTGCRPDTTGVTDLKTIYRDTLPDVQSMPEYFRNHGYVVWGLGKIFHHADKPSFDRLRPHPHKKFYSGYFTEKNIALLQRLQKRNKNRKGPPTEAPDIPDEQLPDGHLATLAVDALRALKKEDRPFFLAVGFVKPHLAHIAPRKYWDLYPKDTIAPFDPTPPRDVPDLALTHSPELGSYYGMPMFRNGEEVSREQAVTLIRGYYACVSFVDAQVGRLLHALDQEGLQDDTIVVLWGDHGYHLGEYGIWGKFTNFENAVRIPLIIRVPGMKNAGQSTHALCEMVDVFPTLCELVGLPLPGWLEGLSLVPVLEDPNVAWKRAAFSQYPRGRKRSGYSMRTHRYRYTEWREKATGAVLARELYDHETDPRERTNLANDPGFSDVVARLAKWMRAGWHEAMPTSPR